MNLFVPKETLHSEKRVAISPENISSFLKLGYEVKIESGAGDNANFPDQLYIKSGARIVSEPSETWEDADLVLKN